MALKRLVLDLAFLLTLCGLFFSGFTYDRPPARNTISVQLRDDQDDFSPQQVHISMVGQNKMRISWITEDRTPAIVQYGTTPGSNQFSASGNTSSYEYLFYHSGKINEVVIGPLTPDTVYFYHCGCDYRQEFSFKTPPAQFPIKFAVVGDLGQTEWTKSTLKKIAGSNYDIMLLPGDLSYADLIQPLWDSFGRLVEPLASQRPWMVTQGNHEIENIPLLHPESFTSYNARWRMPFEESGSESNLYYSFDIAGVHVIMLGSYTDFDLDSVQYKWLQADLGKVDRTRTPWIVVLIHAPWYNTNTAHQGEFEATGMKQAMERLLYGARVDVVFAGHVHAYERFTSVYDGIANACGPVHITIGDGGNREGLATEYIDPKPDISIFREASFGHGQFEVVNVTHALWEWHRNDDDGFIVADSVWLTSHFSNPACRISAMKRRLESELELESEPELELESESEPELEPETELEGDDDGTIIRDWASEVMKVFDGTSASLGYTVVENTKTTCEELIAALQKELCVEGPKDAIKMLLDGHAMADYSTRYIVLYVCINIELIFKFLSILLLGFSYLEWDAEVALLIADTIKKKLDEHLGFDILELKGLADLAEEISHDTSKWELVKAHTLRTRVKNLFLQVGNIEEIVQQWALNPTKTIRICRKNTTEKPRYSKVLSFNRT